MEDFGDYNDFYDDDYVSEELDEHYDLAEDDSPFQMDMHIGKLYEDCVEPTLFSVSDQLGLLFICCLLFKIITQLVSVPKSVSHITSISCGVVGLFSLTGSNGIYTVLVSMATYWTVLICSRKPFGDYTFRIVMLHFLLYLTLREYVIVFPETWEQVRGIQMLIVLKSLSVSFEVANEGQSPPQVLEYFGYIFCPATIVFGPWIPISLYRKLFEKRNCTPGWVLKVFATITFAFLCLAISSCCVYWLFQGVHSWWMLAVRDALSVRFSHYFISLMSEATCYISGFYSDDGSMNVEVTRPSKIEFPRSLVEVVVYWNMPMHQWLKKHVFRDLSRISPFIGILATFFASSLLHGLNFRLTAVLLSLGFYTYVEQGLREKLSNIFDACVRCRPCSSCNHYYKGSHPMVIVGNLAFGALAYLHLAYLGCLLDKKDSEEIQITSQLDKWRKLGFASHWVLLITQLASSLI